MNQKINNMMSQDRLDKYIIEIPILIHSDEIRKLSNECKQYQDVLTQNIVNECIEKMNGEIEDHVMNGNHSYFIDVREIVNKMKIPHGIVNYVSVWDCLMTELSLKKYKCMLCNNGGVNVRWD